MGCAASKAESSSSSSSTNGLGRPPHAQGMNLADLAHLAILDKRFCAVLLSGDLKLLDADFLREVGEKGLERMLKRQDLEDYERRTGTRVFVPPAEAVAIMRGGGRRIASLSYGWCSAGAPDPTNVYLKHVRRFLRQHPLLTTRVRHWTHHEHEHEECHWHKATHSVRTILHVKPHSNPQP